MRTRKSGLFGTPKTEGSAVDQLFIKNVNPEAVVVEMNYNDNPWFPNVLSGEAL